jgi:uncharacterized membrane protein
MNSKAKLFGHALHPILIVFPLGLLSTAVIFDAIWLATGNTKWTEIAYWMIAAGVIGGLVAAIFGLIDYLAIPSGTRAKAVGTWHGVGNLIVILLFIASWWMREPDSVNPATLPVVLSFLGAGLALFTGWLGGELVERLGVGVDDGAHLNSPNSLSGRPASESAPGAQGEAVQGRRPA